VLISYVSTHNLTELCNTPKAKIMALDKKQTPAPKETSGEDLKDGSSKELKKSMDTAEAGAAKKTSATKTPQKIQDGDTSEKKREY